MPPHASIRFTRLICLACGIAVLVGTLSPPALAEESPRTLLAVFAHPDDEQVIMPLLSRYAREGVDVHLAIATDGQKGVFPHTGIPEGEKLAAARAEEARCSCEALGINPPILIGLVDGEIYKEKNKAALVKEVIRLFAELKPDVVITWGPDGVTGHTDHRLVSSVVVQVFQALAADNPAKLFLAGVPAERVEALAQLGGGSGVPVGPQEFALVRSRYLPVRIAYEEEDAQAARKALACHKTQYTPEQAAGMSAMARLLENGAAHLRPWFVDPGPVTDLFE